MFPTKKREWITGNFTNFTYRSWREWTDNQPYAFLWKGYRPLIWNISESGDFYEIQILFLIPSGLLEFVCAVIRTTSADEPHIQKWMEERKLL